MKIIITEEQKKKLFIPRKLSDDDSRYSEWNNSQPIKGGKRINQYDSEGRKQGYWEEYWDNGALDRKGNYINGEKEGYWEIYYVDGELYSKGNYKNSLYNGEWFYYDYHGRLEYKTLYKNGKRVTNLRIDESKKLFIPRKLSDDDSRYSEWNKEQPSVVIDNQTINLNQYSLDGKKIGVWVEKPVLIKKNYDKTKSDMRTIFNDLKSVKPNNTINNYYYNNKLIFQTNKDNIITFYDLYFWREFKNKHSLNYKNYSDIRDLIKLWVEIKNQPITESNKLFIPRKLSDNDSRYSEWNNSQPIINGKPINQYDSEGRKQGYWEHNANDDEYKRSGSYINDKKEGVWEWYYDDGQLWYKGLFVNDKMEGIWEFYDENGKLFNKKLFKNGIWKDIPITESEQPKKKLFIPRKLSDNDSRYSDWNNSQPIKDGKRINQYDSEGRKQGYWEYYQDGKLYSKGNYINGEREGYWETYHSNGQLEGKGNYVNNKKDGMWEYYYETGELWEQGLYVNGNQDGVWQYYHSDGRTMFKKTFKDGEWVLKPITESEQPKKKLFIPRKLSGEDNRYTEWNTQQPTITLDNHTFKLNQYDQNGTKIGVWLDNPERINQNYIKTKPFMENLFNNLKVVKNFHKETNYKLNNKIIFQNRKDHVLTYFYNDFWKGFGEKYNMFTYDTKDLIKVWMEIKYGLGHLYPNQERK